MLLDDDIYKYRQVAAYKRFFEKKYSALSKKNKKNFKDAVMQMKKSLETSPYFHPDDFFADYTMNFCHQFLTQITEKI